MRPSVLRRTRTALGCALAALLLAGPQPARADDGPAAVTPVRISSKSGQVSLSKRDISCTPAGSNRPQVLGAVLAEPGAETLYPNALALNSIVGLGTQGYAVTAATRAFSTGLTRGGGDLMLAGLDVDFNPRWATVIGGPAPDGPSSLTRTPDGGFVVVGTTKSLYLSPMRWLSMGPEAVLVARFDAQGQPAWAQYHAPADDVGVNPVVQLAGGDVVLGGVGWRDGRWAGFLMRLDASGGLRWGRMLGRDHEDGVTWLETLEGGGVLAAGARQLKKLPGVGVLQLPFEVWIAKVDDDGAIVWAKSYAVDSGVSMVVTASSGQGRHLVVREARFDESAGLSRFPVFEIDAAGDVLWAAEYTVPGDARASAVAASTSASGHHLLFGTMIRDGDAGGPFTLEIDRVGAVVAASWLNLVPALSTTDRQAIVPPDPVSVVRDADGRWVLMGDSFSVSRELFAKAKGGSNKLPDSLKADMKALLHFVRLDANGRAGDCSQPLQTTFRPLDVKGVAFELPAVQMPVQKPPFIPPEKLGIERIGPK